MNSKGFQPLSPGEIRRVLSSSNICDASKFLSSYFFSTNQSLFQTATYESEAPYITIVCEFSLKWNVATKRNRFTRLF